MRTVVSDLPSAVPVPAKVAVGYVDFFRDGQVVGWAFDPEQTKPIVQVTIDGVLVGMIVCDEHRDDLVDAGQPASARGFRFEVPAEYFDGERHELAASFVNGSALVLVKDAERRNSLFFRSSFEPEFSGCVDGLKGDVVSGWLLIESQASGRRRGGGRLAVWCDGILVGQIRANASRPDVGAAFAADENCGFSFQLPASALRQGTVVEIKTFPHEWIIPGSPLIYERLASADIVRVRRLERDLESLAINVWRIQRELHTISVPRFTMVSAYQCWAEGYFLDLRQRAPKANAALKVSVLCPVYRPRLRDLASAIGSVTAQTYQNWELVIVDDASGSEDISLLLQRLAKDDARIRIIQHAINQGISAATNTAIEASTGDLIAFFDHDDVLVDRALDFMVDAIVRHDATFAYSDEDKIDDRGELSEPNLKSDWNLRLMLAQNYVCHFLVAKRDAVISAGPFSSKYNGAQDHDFILRLSELVPRSKIKHVSEILYHWRKTPNSTAATISNKSYAIDAGVAAVQDYLLRHGSTGRVTSRGAMTNYIVEWAPSTLPKVSIIIPFKDNVDMTGRCLEMLRKNTNYPSYEIVLVNNFSLTDDAENLTLEMAKQSAARVLDIEEGFNYSRINNLAAATCNNELLLFMNNDVFVSDDTWLTQLVGELTWRDDVGAVGCRLLYENGTIQHAGVVLGVGDGGVAEHAFRGLQAHDPGFMGRALCSQEYSAVTAACLLTRRSLFQDVGGFDETQLTVAFNDVDLCLKIREAGYRVVWRAETTLEHHESVSRTSDMAENKLGRFVNEHIVMKERWGAVLADDPYYNRHFSREWGVFDALSNTSSVDSS